MHAPLLCLDLKLVHGDTWSVGYRQWISKLRLLTMFSLLVALIDGQGEQMQEMEDRLNVGDRVIDQVKISHPKVNVDPKIQLEVNGLENTVKQWNQEVVGEELGYESEDSEQKLKWIELLEAKQTQQEEKICLLRTMELIEDGYQDLGEEKFELDKETVAAIEIARYVEKDIREAGKKRKPREEKWGLL
jgi:hypothetical protein